MISSGKQIQLPGAGRVPGGLSVTCDFIYQQEIDRGKGKDWLLSVITMYTITVQRTYVNNSLQVCSLLYIVFTRTTLFAACTHCSVETSDCLAVTLCHQECQMGTQHVVFSVMSRFTNTTIVCLLQFRRYVEQIWVSKVDRTLQFLHKRTRLKWKKKV